MEKFAPNSGIEITGKFKTPPKKHQLVYLNEHGSKEAFALFAEMGTGKTWMTLLNTADLWASGDVTGLFVVAPNGVHLNWLGEIEKHLPDWVRYRAAAWSASPNKKERVAMDNLYEGTDSSELRIFTMNWEALQTKKGYEAAERFCRTCRSLMIAADESIRMKNPKAERTKSMLKLKRHSKYRRIMDGHPVGNSPFDLFSQFLFLDESILGTTSFSAFKAEYADMLQEGNPLLSYIKDKGRMHFTPQIVAKDRNGKPMYKNLDKLNKLIAPHMYRVLKKDCMDLPPKIYKTVLFKMTPKQAAIYKKAKDECRIVYDNNETPFNKLVAVGKLAQITSGYYIHPMSPEPVRIEGENLKLELLKDRVREVTDQGHKVIVWARFRIEIADIVAALKDEGFADSDIVEYHGGVKNRERPEEIKRFEEGDAKIFVGNQQAGGTGITLVSASYVIYFSNDFSSSNRLQSEDRAHRIGQTKSVTYINIAAQGTIDEAVIRSLEAKASMSDDIMGDMKGDAELADELGDLLFKEN